MVTTTKPRSFCNILFYNQRTIDAVLKLNVTVVARHCVLRLQKAMAQFKWHDGSIRNIHVDMSQLFEYQKQLGATVKLYEQRLDWLSSGSRKIFGSVKEKRCV